MTFSRLSRLLASVALASTFGSVQADVLTEDFSLPFPAWQSDWFGTHSSALNYYCQGPQGCGFRGDNADGLWVVGATGGSVVPVEVSFDAAFGASLVSFKLDVAGYEPTTLQAFDSANHLIFSQDVALTFGADSDPGIYSSYTIHSGSGISRFTFSGGAAGNTSIDNLVATTGGKTGILTIAAPVPEPETYALILAGLGIMGFLGRRQRT